MKYDVGRTLEGKVILVDDSVMEGPIFQRDFVGFSDYDLFDGLLALDYFSLSESRRPSVDLRWLRAISSTQLFLSMCVSPETLRRRKEELGIRSAFVARDYGRERIHPHFRFL